MKYTRFLVTLAACTVLTAHSAAQADLLCIKKKVKANKGKVALGKSLVTTTDAECPKATTMVLDTSVFKGQKGDTGDIGPTGDTGATGAQGPAGLLNLSSCVAETQTFGTCNAGFACTNVITCGNPGTNGSNVDDMILHWGWQNDTDAAYVVAVGYGLDSGGTYPTALSLTTTSEDGFADHVPTVSVVCCSPN